MDTDLLLLRCAVIGRGRLGTALAAALRAVGVHVCGPLGRDGDVAGNDVVLLAVPDGEIAAAAATVTGIAGPGTARPMVGHCSGATPLGDFDLALHPLMTVTEGADATVFAGATCAVAGATSDALDVATQMALVLGMRPITLDDSDRAAYHAAASIASNFLITLQAAAERLAATAGLDRDALVPLVRATVENWATLGAERALTGPIARGDEATIAAHRGAIEQRAPDLRPLYDALAAATGEFAAAPVGVPGPTQVAGAATNSHRVLA